MNDTINQAAAAIIAATGLDSRHHADLNKTLAAVYAAGQETARPVETVSPLTPAEIAALRALARSHA